MQFGIKFKVCGNSYRGTAKNPRREPANTDEMTNPSNKIIVVNNPLVDKKELKKDYQTVIVITTHG